MTLFFILFAAGMLTILLPCILPLIPIVLGVSVAGRSKWRPLLTVLGMLVSFVGFVWLLQVVLSGFRGVVTLDFYFKAATYYILLLFGVGFSIHDRKWQWGIAIVGSVFFSHLGTPLLQFGETDIISVSTIIAAILGVVAMESGGRIASRIQQLGGSVQQKARSELGEDQPITAFIMGLTMGLVWVPCAGPALGFVYTLIREEPGLKAFIYLMAYGAGTALPLLLVGYGGQKATQSVRALNKYSGKIKQWAGYVLIITALAFHFGWFRQLEIWVIEHTPFGNIGVDLEERFFGERIGNEAINQ